MINFKNVSIYKDGQAIVDDITYDFEDNKFIYLVGKTGSGKTSILKLIRNEISEYTGELIVNNLDLKMLNKKNDFIYKRKIGNIYQDFRLLNSKTVSENIMYAGEIINMDKESIESRLVEVLSLTGLNNKKNSFPSTLSGGEIQKVAIARAIFNKPSILLADEPTGNLDPISASEIFKLLEKINKKEQTLIICATHNLQLANQFKHKTIFLQNGKIVKTIND